MDDANFLSTSVNFTMNNKLHEERKRLEEIKKISNVIRQKFKLMKEDASDKENAIQEFFKPVVTPLNEILKTTKKSEFGNVKTENVKHEKPKKEYFPEISDDSDNDQEEQPLIEELEKQEKIEKDEAVDDVNEIIEPDLDDTIELNDHDVTKRMKYFIDLTKKKHKKIDSSCGVRILSKGFRIGDKPIKFKDDKIVFEDGNTMKTSMGLLELIFKVNPNEDLITPTDKEKYKNLILLTNAHRKHYKEINDIRNKDPKYIHVISKLLNEHGGQGLPEFMVEKKCKSSIDYLYYKDVNKLVERLQLLTASRLAGNTNHSNEILSILDELRENKIIY